MEVAESPYRCSFSAEGISLLVEKAWPAKHEDIGVRSRKSMSGKLQCLALHNPAGQTGCGLSNARFARFEQRLLRTMLAFTKD